MEKLIIDFDMTSLDSCVKFDTFGEYKNNRIKFTDTELDKHYIVFKGSTIEYYKKGSMDMKFIFDIDNPTTGTYKIDNNNFVFDIKTIKLENTSNRLVIEYHLFVDGEIVNKSTLKIMYSIAKEE